MYVIKCMGYPVEGMPCEWFGQYLAYYEPDGYGMKGLIRWTRSYTDALIFQTSDAAIDTVLLTSKTMPLRPDGKPNRPLTAFSVEIANIDKEK